MQVNVECLEGLFDTWGTFGRGFLGNLEQGGPPPIGAQKANIVSPRTLAFLQEVALNEQVRYLSNRRTHCSDIPVCSEDLACVIYLRRMEQGQWLQCHLCYSAKLPRHYA